MTIGRFGMLVVLGCCSTLDVLGLWMVGRLSAWILAWCGDPLFFLDRKMIELITYLSRLKLWYV